MSAKVVRSYIHIVIRYYRTHAYPGILYLLCLSVGMGSLLLFLSSFIHGLVLSQSVPFLAAALVIALLYGMSINLRLKKRGLSEADLRHIYGADILDQFFQLLIETLMIFLVSGILSLVFLDITFSRFPFHTLLSTKSQLFDLQSLVLFFISIPALAMIAVLFPTFVLYKRCPNIRIG